jgi:DNA-3-methyladenine glycosylase II
MIVDMAWLDRRSASLQAGLDRDLLAAAKHLRRCDPVLAELVDRFGAHELYATTNAFQVMLETIVSQQLSTHAARSIYARVAALLGARSPRPRNLLDVSHADLVACGLSRSKAEYALNVAAAFEKKRLTRRTFQRMSDAEVTDVLTSIKGVGDWSAHMFLIFALNRLDVFPVGDLSLRKTMMTHYHLRRNTRPERLERIAEKWRPYRTVGTLYMWRSYDPAPAGDR